MGQEKDIKSMNRKYLIGYMLLNCLIFLILSGIFSGGLDEIESLYKKTTNIFGFLLIPLSIVFEGLLSPDFKYKLVLWRIENPLPACRAFSEIGPNDPRIDMSRLNLLLCGNIPESPEKENATWYGLYKKCSSKDRVFDAHKCFLLMRDLASLSFTSIPVAVASYTLWGIPLRSMAIHLVFLVAMFLLTSVACQNYGKRFVANVLVESLHTVE